MPSLREQILYLMNNYLQAKTEPFKEHELGKLVRRDIPDNIYKQTGLNKDNYLIRGSVGQGNWAYVPWVAVMNKEITTSTQRGYYLVYLFTEDMSKVYLAFAQGVTETPSEEMKRINKDIREKIEVKESNIFKNNDFHLGNSKFARDYKKSTAMHIPYSVDDFPSEEQLLNDLKLMVKYYEEYIKITSENLLPKSIDKLLRQIIASTVNKSDYSEAYGETKLELLELLKNNTPVDFDLTYNGKEVFNRLPFVFSENDNFQLATFTIDELPSSNYQTVINTLINMINKNEPYDKVDSRILQSLYILGYADGDLLVDEVPDLTEQQRRVKAIPVLKYVITLLELTSEWQKHETEKLLMDVLEYSIIHTTSVSSEIQNLELDDFYHYIIDWLQEVQIIDENLKLIKSEIILDYQRDALKENVREAANVANEKELIDHIHNYITSKGFYYTKEEITNFYLSLRSKPFVILSGISGTGKTKMVQWFAESVGATDKNERFTLIPIRPDWNDGSDLLGYVDIKGDFKAGPLTKVINNATENPEEPYFVLLDEMNLARVEHYFSDILSVMESRKWEDGKVVSSNLLTKETAGSDLQLPNNLYIIGTVNMDETTYPFSKKVLDRANTIEFNRVDLDHFAFLEEVDLVEPEPLPVGNEWFQSEFLHLKDAYHHHKELIARVTDELVRINHVLERSNAHVGYRVRDEICFYMIYSAKDDLMHFDTALDHCILQKILPRISGSDSSVEQLLRGLFEIFTNMTFDEDLIDDDDFAFDSVKYPKSTKKVIEMYRRLSDGYTSFWIS